MYCTKSQDVQTGVSGFVEGSWCQSFSCTPAGSNPYPTKVLILSLVAGCFTENLISREIPDNDVVVNSLYMKGNRRDLFLKCTWSQMVKMERAYRYLCIGCHISLTMSLLMSVIKVHSYVKMYSMGVI